MNSLKWDWEEIETPPINIGDFVGVKGMDWDLEVYFPCIIYEIIDDNYVIVSECVSYHINCKQSYSKVRIDELQIMDNKQQLKWYKKLEYRTKINFTELKTQKNKNGENWLDYIKKFKNYET